ncbi:MAG: prepilin-type N-terminal cleavage/methylation domain-containing protein [Smithellaceae bacterium]|nr:prepilin-type N-terminal cleavage/methylation domain-containing protein [Smithellaceae bacterium]
MIDPGEKNKCATMVRRRSRSAFTLVELLIAMTVGLIILGAIYAVYTVQNREFVKQERNVDMQQSARAAMDMMVREIDMAGYNNPLNVAGAGITGADATSLSFTADLNDNGSTTSDSLNPGENIAYDLCNSGGIQSLCRSSNGARQPLADNIDAIDLRYWDVNGQELARPVATARLNDIRRIQITITAKSAKPDPNTGQYRTYTLVSQVFPRNISAIVSTAGTTTAASTSSTSVPSSLPSSSTSSSSSSSTTTSIRTTTSTSTSTSSSSSTTTITNPGPSYSNVTQNPSGTQISNYTSSVEVCANITDADGIRSAKITTDQGDNVTMTRSGGNNYCGDIPRHRNTTVTYWITAVDNQGNSSRSVQNYYYHQGN